MTAIMWILRLALFTGLAIAKVIITNSDFAVEAGKPFTITWSGATTVTLNLKNGPSTNLATVSTITTAATGGSFTWTPPTNLPGGAYAFEIIDPSDPSNPNYSPQFSLSGGEGASLTTGPASSTRASALTSSSKPTTSPPTTSLSSTSEPKTSASVTHSTSATSQSTSSPTATVSTSRSVTTTSRPSSSGTSSQTIPNSNGTTKLLASSLAPLLAVAAFMVHYL